MSSSRDECNPEQPRSFTNIHLAPISLVYREPFSQPAVYMQPINMAVAGERRAYAFLGSWISVKIDCDDFCTVLLFLLISLTCTQKGDR